MPKEVIVVLSLLGMLLVGFLGMMLGVALMAPPKTQAQKAEELQQWHTAAEKQITYFQDTRTGMCFAGKLNDYDNSWGGPVECTPKVLENLSNGFR